MTNPSGRIAIIGGGIMGCLCAWFLRRQGFVGEIVVIERDPSYRFSSTALSAASIRSQFACPVNVELSLYGIEFLRNIKTLLDQDAEIGLVENGYLILGSHQSIGARRDALAMQKARGASVCELDLTKISARYPWLYSKDIGIATLGTAGEGWFDAWAFLRAARAAAMALDVRFVQDEAVGLETCGAQIVSVALASGDRILVDVVVNAAGALSARVCDWIGVPLPVAPRKRTVFHFKAPLDPCGFPMLFDISGAWMRPEGEGFICGIQPPSERDPDAYGDFEPDHDLFEETLWPLLAERIPALEELRLLSSWAGHYEMNLFDHNGIVGPLPDISNFILATGFSGHGVMHAPGVARGVAELIVTGNFQSIDLAPLAFQRIPDGMPMPESAIY